MTALTMKTAKGRADITACIEAAIREGAPEAEIVTRPGWLDPRETSIKAKINGATVHLDVDADSTWGILGAWTSTRDICSSFGAMTGGGVNPHHFRKATGPHCDGPARGTLDADAFETFLGKLTRCCEWAASELAFDDDRAAA